MPLLIKSDSSINRFDVLANNSEIGININDVINEKIEYMRPNVIKGKTIIFAIGEIKEKTPK
jgi:hypothetical protein